MPNPLRKSDVVRAGEDEDEGEWNCGDIPNFLLPSQFPCLMDARASPLSFSGDNYPAVNDVNIHYNYNERIFFFTGPDS